jgi:solute carrier family 35 protein
MAFAYVLNVCLGLIGLQLVNVPMFFCIRRTTTAFILLYEFISQGKIAEQGIRGSVAVICMGAILAGVESVRFDFLGFLITISNNMATAAASVMQKQFNDVLKTGAPEAAAIGPFGIMYYQSLTALPLCLFLAFATGEFSTLLAFEHLGSFVFWLALFIASVIGLLLSYSSLLCTTYNSPLTTSITGNAKDVVLTIVGAMLFPGFTATLLSVGGLLLSFFGSAMYTAVSVKKHFSDSKALSKDVAGGPAPSHVKVVSTEDEENNSRRRAP